MLNLRSTTDRVFSLILFAAIIRIARCENKCVHPNTFEYYLSSKTPYRIVANTNTSSLPNYKSCEPVKLWGLIRHGTRTPNKGIIEKMGGRLLEIRDLILEHLPEANEEVTHRDLDAWRKWNTKLELKDSKKLTHEGEDEMLLLAERLQKRFPQIFSNIYSESLINFKFTDHQRTRKSALKFATGLFGRNVAKDINYPEPTNKDPILRFYKLCNKWRQAISKNATARLEKQKFDEGIVMKKTIEEINKRLKLENELDINDIHTMYMVCAFETAWNKKLSSPWCAPFTIDNLKVFEYSEDLKYYWVDGYGFEINYKQACPALNAVINFFKNSEKLPKAEVSFTHSGTLLKMLAHLGLYKDPKPLTSDDFYNNGNRKWRSSHIDAFGSNLIFVLYRCGEDEEKILTLHQEEIVRLPSCPSEDLCPLEKVVSYYEDSVDSCEFEEMCRIEV